MILLTGVLFFFLLTLVPYQVYSSSQLHYFLYPMHQVRPDLFAKDWLVTQTANPHPFFTSLIAGLMNLGDLTPWLFLIRVLQLVLLAVGILRLSRVLSEDRRTGPLVFLFLFFYFSDGLGQESLYSAIIQPSDLGRLFYLFSLIFLLEGKPLGAGIFLGLTGLFDFLSGAEGALLLLLFWVLQGRPWPLSRIAGALAVFLFLASPNFFPIFQHFSPLESVPAPGVQKLLFNFRGPHHYRFGNFELAHVFRVLFPLYFIFFVNSGKEDERMRKRVRVYAGLLLSLCVLAIVSIEWVYLPSIVQFRFLRLSPFLLILGLAALGSTLLREAASGGRIGIFLSGLTMAVLFLAKDSRLFIPLAAVLVLAWTFRSAASLVIAAVSILGLHLFWGRGMEFAFDSLLALVLILLLRWKPSKNGARVLWSLMFLGLPALAFHGIFPDRISFHPIQAAPPSPLFKDNAELRETLEWIRKHTPRDAVLLTPPDQEGIRFFSERAIVVDFHANPYRAEEVWEWEERLEAVSGLKGLEKWDPHGGNTNAQREFLRQGYLRLTAPEVESLAGRYGADYFLIEAGYAGESALLERGHRLVFENRRYHLFRIFPSTGKLEVFSRG